MLCKSCGASNLSNFAGEVAIHFSGLTNIDKPPVFLFPEFLVCLNCGTAVFAVSENEMKALATGDTPHNIGKSELYRTQVA